MKISYKWLKDLMNFSLTAEETAAILTDCGLEVEGVETFETVRGGLRGLKIAPPSAPYSTAVTSLSPSRNRNCAASPPRV